MTSGSILLGYGVSVAIGNVWGGKLADKHGAVSALKFIFAALVVLLLVFQLTASVHYAALATVLVMGIFAFGNVPGLQVYVVQKAEQYTPGAVDVASGLNIAAFNVGIALGSIDHARRVGVILSRGACSLRPAAAGQPRG